MSLHPHNGQIASHSKISVPARGMLRTIWLHNGMTHLHNWMSGCAMVWNINSVPEGCSQVIRSQGVKRLK